MQFDVVSIPKAKFGNILGNKKELYYFLDIEGEFFETLTLKSLFVLNLAEFFLPPFEECSADYLRDIFQGKKKIYTVNFSNK